MPTYTTEDIRNIALVGHGGAGKTSLAEALLYEAGAVTSKGDVTKGNTVCDHDPQEKEHQHSLQAAMASLEHQGKHINLIDTPGYPDLIGRALPVLSAVETAAVVVDARAGVEMVTRRTMDAATTHQLCRMIIINKIDADDIDLSALFDDLVEAFGRECLPLNLPSPGGDTVADCFFELSDAATSFSSVEEAHTKIVDQVVEVDEELMELYLEQGEEIGHEQLHDAFEKALREGHLIPVCFASANTGAGIPELLQVMARLMPNPSEANPPQFEQGAAGERQPLDVEPDPGRPFLAHVFKVLIDPFVGRLALFRIYQGRVSKDTQLYVGSGRKPFKVGHLFKLQGKDHSEVDEGNPGDICCLAKVDDIHAGDVLRDAAHGGETRLRAVETPAPMYGLAVRAKTRGDEQKLSDALTKLQAEDPCFLVEQNTSTNETVMRGLGELHLRLTLERMRERFNVEVDTRPPKIAYCETITAGAEGHHRHKKQTGGAGQFGEVYLRVEPLARGAGFEFVDAVVGGVIPQQFIPAVEKGVKQVLVAGAVAGYPLKDVKVTVYDGKHHPVDSKEVAFIAAGKKAFLDAVMKAKPIVLEPIVHVEVTVPQANMGDVAGDISGKRGRINGTAALPGGMVTVSGQVPLSELENYQSELKSVTGGAGSYSMEFSHYDPVPAQTQQKLRAEFAPAQDED